MAVVMQPSTTLAGNLALGGLSMFGGYGQGYGKQSGALLSARPTGAQAAATVLAPFNNATDTFTSAFRQSYGTLANIASQERAQQARALEQNNAHKFAIEAQGLEGKMRLNDWSMKEYQAPLVEGDPRFGIPGQQGYVPSLEANFAQQAGSGQGASTFSDYVGGLDNAKRERVRQDWLKNNGLQDGLLPAEERQNASTYAAIARLQSDPGFYNAANGQYTPEYYSAVNQLQKRIIPKHPVPIGANIPPQDRYMSETAVDPETGRRMTRSSTGQWKEAVTPPKTPTRGMGGGQGTGASGGAVNDFVNMTLTGQAAGIPVADIAQYNQIRPFHANPELDVVTDARGNSKPDSTRADFELKKRERYSRDYAEAVKLATHPSKEGLGEEVNWAEVDRHLRAMGHQTGSSSAESGPATPQTSAPPNIPDLMPLPQDPTKPDGYEVGKVYPLTRNGQKVYGRYKGKGLFDPYNPQ